MKRLPLAIGIFLCFSAHAIGQSMQFELAGDGQLTVRAKAQQQQWILLGDQVLVAAVVDGKLQVQKFTWSAQPYRPQPGPTPPDPTPPPPPPPPPPPDTKWQVAIVIESNDLDNLTADQKTLLASLTVRQELQQKGHRLVGILDPDVAGTATEEMKPWFQAARGYRLPVVLLAPMAGGQIRVFPLPVNTAEFWKLLENPPAQENSPPQQPKTSLPARCLGRRCFR